LIEKEPGEGTRIVENWNTVMMEYMKSQTPSTISQGFGCQVSMLRIQVSGVRCQEKAT
jgi:hypothetical protein